MVRPTPDCPLPESVQPRSGNGLWSHVQEHTLRYMGRSVEVRHDIVLHSDAMGMGGAGLGYRKWVGWRCA